MVNFCQTKDLRIFFILSAIHFVKYQNCDGFAPLGSLGKSFYRGHLIAKAESNLKESFHLIKCCIWDCDDRCDCIQTAVGLRLLAAGYLKELINSEKDPDMHKTYILMLIDLYRRAGEFDKASDVIDRHSSEYSDEIFNTVAGFQRFLILRKDTGCYTVSDAAAQATD